MRVFGTSSFSKSNLHKIMQAIADRVHWIEDSFNHLPHLLREEWPGGVQARGSGSGRPGTHSFDEYLRRSGFDESEIRTLTSGDDPGTLRIGSAN